MLCVFCVFHIQRVGFFLSRLTVIHVLESGLIFILICMYPVVTIVLPVLIFLFVFFFSALLIYREL